MGKNRFIKIFALICALLMLASCSSEINTDGTTTSTQAQSQPNGDSVVKPDFKLGYNADDSLNPYEAESAANCAITRLMFDSLFVCDNSFAPKALIAEKYEHSGDVVTVYLKQGVLFSDGSLLTSSDVSYSYSLAKKSSVYSGRLSDIAYITVVDDYTVKFVLNEDNPYVVSCLDFPIVKANSYAGTVGSGRYRYINDVSNGKMLVINPNYSLDKNDGFDVIELCDMGTTDTVAYKVKNGEVDFVYDNLSSGNVPNISTSSSIVALNNMVFLGMNSESELLKLQSVRNAVRSAVDTQAVTDAVYGAFANASNLPFHPDWYATDRSYTFESKSTLEYLSAIGYNRINDEGFATNGWYTLTLDLIVNDENEQRVKLAQEIADSLIASGINVNVKKYSFKEYVSAIKAKNYDLYLGEVRLTNDMNLSELFGGYVYYQSSNEYGIDRNNESRQAYEDFISGEISMNEFLDVFMQSCPFVPICFRNSVAIFSRSLGGTGTMLAGDIFYGISEWSIS